MKEPVDMPRSSLPPAAGQDQPGSVNIDAAQISARLQNLGHDLVLDYRLINQYTENVAVWSPSPMRLGNASSQPETSSAQLIPDVMDEGCSEHFGHSHSQTDGEWQASIMQKEQPPRGEMEERRVTLPDSGQASADQGRSSQALAAGWEGAVSPAVPHEIVAGLSSLGEDQDWPAAEGIDGASSQGAVEIHRQTPVEGLGTMHALDLEWLRQEDPDAVRDHLMSFSGISSTTPSPLPSPRFHQHHYFFLVMNIGTRTMMIACLQAL